MLRPQLKCLLVALLAQVIFGTRIQPQRLPDGPSNGYYSTKLVSGVPIIVADEKAGRNKDYPLTLAPSVVSNGFAIKPTKSSTAGPGGITKTEFSTFTYFITSLSSGTTVTSTDTVISSNIVVVDPSVKPTPALTLDASLSVQATPALTLNDQISSLNSENTDGLKLLATRTYFTTSTYYTTLIEKSSTITKTRSSIRSRIVTDTYSGGQFDYIPAPIQSTIVPLIEQDPEEKYLSVGPNIYGLVKTFYATYTYYTTNPQGLSDQSLEVITQVSTSFFSTSQLPSSIVVSMPSKEIVPTASLQLDKDSLLSIKQSFILEQGQISGDIQPSLTVSDVTQTQLAEDGLSSQVSVSSSSLLLLQTSSPEQSLLDNLPETDISIPVSSAPITRPPVTVELSESVKPSKPLDVDDVTSTSAVISVETEEEVTTEPTTNAPEESNVFTNGLLGAVVGGISSAFTPQNNNGANVDLGPVLDAVATLLRGPIRSAIANRRNTAYANDRSSDESTTVTPTKVLSIPKIARVHNTETPNLIPVGGAVNSRYISQTGYDFIPLNGAQPYSGQALPRFDVSSEIEADDNYRRQNPPQHIIQEDNPQYIDVLNKYEHSYLSNKHQKDSLKIKIVPGREVNQYQYQTNPSSNYQPSTIQKPPPPRPQGEPHQHRSHGPPQNARLPSPQGGGQPPPQSGGHPPSQSEGHPPPKGGGHPTSKVGGTSSQKLGGHPPQHSGRPPPSQGKPPPPWQQIPRPNHPPPRHNNVYSGLVNPGPNTNSQLNILSQNNRNINVHSNAQGLQPNNAPLTSYVPLAPKSRPSPPPQPSNISPSTNTYVPPPAPINQYSHLPTNSPSKKYNNNPSNPYQFNPNQKYEDSSTAVSENRDVITPFNQGINPATRISYDTNNRQNLGQKDKFAESEINAGGVISYTNAYNPSTRPPVNEYKETDTSPNIPPSTANLDPRTSSKISKNRKDEELQKPVTSEKNYVAGFLPNQPISNQYRPTQTQGSAKVQGYGNTDQKSQTNIGHNTAHSENTNIQDVREKRKEDSSKAGVDIVNLDSYEESTHVYSELEPSFTVSSSLVLGSNPASHPTFTSVSSSKNNYDYEGWLTDGDPLKNLPPLRPTTTLDITAVEHEAPKTVTYSNEWQTPLDLPTASFEPQNPPPPNSNFEREWTAFEKNANPNTSVLRPTKSLSLTVTDKEAPKTVTYASEWFANTLKPSQVTKQYSQITRRPDLGDARIEVVSPYDDEFPSNRFRSSTQKSINKNTTPRATTPNYRSQEREKPRRPLDQQKTYNRGQQQYGKKDKYPQNSKDQSGFTQQQSTTPQQRPEYTLPQDQQPQQQTGYSELQQHQQDLQQQPGPGYLSQNQGQFQEQSGYPVQQPDNPLQQLSPDLLSNESVDLNEPNPTLQTYLTSTLNPSVDNENVRNPSRSTTSNIPKDSQVYDPYEEYQANYPVYDNFDYVETTGTSSSNTVFNFEPTKPSWNQEAEGLDSAIKVTPDGYVGYKKINNYPTSPANYPTDLINEASTESVQKIVKVETISDGYNGFIERVTSRPVRPNQDSYLDTQSLSNNQDSPGTFQEPFENSSPTIDWANSDVNKEGSKYFTELIDQGRKENKKRKYDATILRSSSVSNKGEPTFINIGNIASTNAFESLVTPPSKTTPAIVTLPDQEVSGNIIQPQKSTQEAAQVGRARNSTYFNVGLANGLSLDRDSNKNKDIDPYRNKDESLDKNKEDGIDSEGNPDTGSRRVQESDNEGNLDVINGENNDYKDKEDKKNEGRGSVQNLNEVALPDGLIRNPDVKIRKPDGESGRSEDRTRLLENKKDEEISQNEVLNNNLEAAIVEQIPGNALSADESDPTTKCQKSCGENEVCHISEDTGIECKCRPGFGRRSNLPDATCEKSQMYQIEVFTTSESQETRIVRFNPRLVQQAVDTSFENKIKDIFQGSEITSIKVSNTTKRNYPLGTNNTNDRDAKDNMEIKMLIKINDESTTRNATEERLRSLLEPSIKSTKFPLGTEVKVSRVSIEDYDECETEEYNDCSPFATCTNTKGSYNCECRSGFLDLSSTGLTGRVCTSASTECDLCNKNGQCVLEKEQVSCACKPWFAGKNCQINLKLLLIVGAVSATLMMLIACGVSCFCCKDRRKRNIPMPYGVSMARLPPNMRHNLIMDHGTVKSGMSSRTRQQRQPSSLQSNQSMRSSSHPWQDHFGSTGSRGSHAPSLHPAPLTSRPAKPSLAIPRAKVGPTRSSGFSDDERERFSTPTTEKNRAISEVASLASRHRRPSVPSFAGGFRGKRGGSVDPLLEGFQSDGGESVGTFHRSVSRGDLDMVERADTHSVSRSYNETIIRPVTRKLHTPAGTSYRSNRSNRTSEEGRTMADRDGGSSFVVSPHQQLYRLQDSDGSFESL